MRITIEWLRANTNHCLSPSKKQCEVLGIPYPLRSGWKEQLIAKDVDDRTAEFFSRLKGLHYKDPARHALIKAWRQGAAPPEVVPPQNPKPAKPDSVRAVAPPAIAKKQRRSKRRERQKRRQQYVFVLSDAFYHSPEWRELRYRVLKHYGGKCMLCGRSYREHGVVIHVDHIKPRSTHPELALDFDNLQVLCEPCNLGKSNTDQTDFRPRGAT